MIFYATDQSIKEKFAKKSNKIFATVLVSYNYKRIRLSSELSRVARLGDNCTIGYNDETNELILFNSQNDNIHICRSNTTHDDSSSISIEKLSTMFFDKIERGRYEAEVLDGKVYIKLNNKIEAVKKQ